MSEKIIVKGNTKLLKPVITELMALRQILDSKDIGTFYGSVNTRNTTRRAGKPKVTLYFLEDSNFNKLAPPNNVYEGIRRQEGIISFRLMNETTGTVSKANASTLARKIKEVFGSNNGFVWNKGKTMYSYSDWNMGYQLQLLCRNITEAKRITSNVLSLQTHTPNWKYFNTIKNDEELIKYPEEPGTQFVMGETIPILKERPLVDVRFQYGYLNLDGVKDPINLYDRRNKLPRTLVS